MKDMNDRMEALQVDYANQLRNMQSRVINMERAQTDCCHLIHTSSNVEKIFKPLGATLKASKSQVLSLDLDSSI